MFGPIENRVVYEGSRFKLMGRLQQFCTPYLNQTQSACTRRNTQKPRTQRVKMRILLIRYLTCYESVAFD